MEELTESLLHEVKQSLIEAKEKENTDCSMTGPRVEEDEPESDDQGEQTFNSPLTSTKDLLKTEVVGSDSTLMTSPCSSRIESSISFNDSHQIVEIDCNWTEKQVTELWFTKDEYDEFLQACDEDAQKCEEYEKEKRVNKLKKDLRKQRRQKNKEQKTSQNEVLDESMNSMALMEQAEDIVDDAADDDTVESKRDMIEDEEGGLCSLGLEAGTLEGYKEREHHRQKAIDAVLNEQYAAWDRGMVENVEMMSALYFAASATSKHSATKKARELEDDVQKYTVISTLEDYNKAVQALNVLQKSLHCIKGKNKKGNNKSVVKSRANRRGSIESTASSIGAASSIIDRALAVAEESNDQAPQAPNQPRPPPEPPLSPGSLQSRLKAKQQRTTRLPPQKIYKSKAATNIIYAPPTPPVTKRGTLVYKPSHGESPTSTSSKTPKTISTRKTTKSPTSSPTESSTKSPTKTKSPKKEKSSKKLKSPKSPSKNRKIVYKPIVSEEAKGEKTKSVKTAKTTKTSKKSDTKKKKKKDRSESPKRRKSETDKTSTKSLRKSRRSSMPEKLSSSPRKSRRASMPEKISSSTAHSVSSQSTKPLTQSTHTSSSRKPKKEHWFYQQQKLLAGQ